MTRNVPKLKTLAITKRGESFNEILSEVSDDSLERPQKAIGYQPGGLFQPLKLPQQQ